VMAAGPAGINSGLNSMASTFVTDVYRPKHPGRHDAHYVRVSRLAVVAWGVVLAAFALLCIPWFRASGQTIIGFVLGLMNFAYAGLLGVFLTALFTRRGSVRSVVLALIVGALVAFALRPEAWRWALVLWSGDENAAPGFKLAFPWQLVMATLAAFLTAAAGRPRIPLDRGVRAA
jgi:solute:Na+ symporter, SSS family